MLYDTKLHIISDIIKSFERFKIIIIDSQNHLKWIGDSAIFVPFSKGPEI
jgi:hypothetical protein